MAEPLEWTSRERLMAWLAGLAGLFMLGWFVVVPMDVMGQTLTAAVTVFLLVIIYFSKHPAARLAIATLAVITSARYMFWRATNTMELESTAEYVLGYIALISEGFLWFMLLTSYAQNLWPAGRKVAALPQDMSEWPTVDVYIPTYNEPLSIVEPTVLAALAMDYPADRFNVYVLDDGRRDEFKAFAERVGANYIRRADNKFAKAGNLNNAMQHTDGELIAVFDCDHVPTREFLQKTVGWFCRDPRMALVQTPHHFYNPDPVERNLVVGNDLPNEGLLFYGLTQDGNDFWNATYFCGSCAVLKREALEEIGGFAVETVTEDAHTSLRIHRKGWNSAYIRQALAAGLATESVADHVGQRMRWARGMLQILRIENPLFCSGLTFSQRMCYLNSMMHFMFPIPRIALLAAPMIFLLLGMNIINANAYELLAYAGPHLLVAMAASLLVIGRYRLLFWAEIYETLLSFHLAIPTLLTMLNPFGGKFNVTAKGKTTGESFYQARLLLMPIAFACLLVVAFGIGVWRLFFAGLEPGQAGTTIINLIWVSISILFTVTALAIGREAREFRRSPRINVEMQGLLHLPAGHCVPTRTVDMSLSGAAVQLSSKMDLPGLAFKRLGHLPGVERGAQPAATTLKPVGDENPDLSAAEQLVQLELPCGMHSTVVQARPIARSGDVLHLRFEEPLAEADALGQRKDVVRTLLGQKGRWAEWDQVYEPTLGKSLRTIIVSVGDFVGYCLRSTFSLSNWRRDTV